MGDASIKFTSRKDLANNLAKKHGVKPQQVLMALETGWESMIYQSLDSTSIAEAKKSNLTPTQYQQILGDAWTSALNQALIVQQKKGVLNSRDALNAARDTPMA